MQAAAAATTAAAAPEFEKLEGASKCMCTACGLPVLMLWQGYVRALPLSQMLFSLPQLERIITPS
jgi:hypothetical protein